MSKVVISEEFRTLRIPISERVLGCVGDHGVRTVEFVAPRYCDGYDMADFIFQVHFEGADGTEDFWAVSDAEVGDDEITFSWTPSSVAFTTAGTVCASVRAYEDSGEDEFNTQQGEFTVKETLRSEAAGAALVDDTGDLIVVTVEGSGN